MPLTLIGTKLIKAIPMSRLAYNQYRGWVMPGDENGAEPGYLVEYDERTTKSNHANHRGYITWSPKSVTDVTYRETTGMSFGLAVEALKLGHRVSRPSWNGKGMWLVLVQPGHYDVGCRTIGYTPDQGDFPEFAPWIGMKTAQNVFTPWAPAQSDVLADDWQIVEAVVAPVTSDTTVVRIPLLDGDRKSLFGLLLKDGIEFDCTDSIDSVKLLRVVSRDGVEIKSDSAVIKNGRNIVFNGSIGIVQMPFSICISPETSNTTVSVRIPEGYPMEMFVELEVKRTNLNRRPQ